MTNGLIFNIDYSKIKVFDEYNTTDIQYPLLLSIPHAGSFLPPEFLQKTASAPDALHKNEDYKTDELVKSAVDEGICTLKMNVSRVFIDVNRDKMELDSAMFYDYPNEENPLRSTRCRYGIGLIHRVDSTGHEIYPDQISFSETMKRVEKIYDIYHHRLQTLIDECVNKFGVCLLLDIHSMPSKICTIVDENKKIDVCVGDLFEQSCPTKISKIFIEQLEREGIAVSRNIPYSGAFITFNYCQPRKKVYTLQIEVNRNIYTDEQNMQKNENFQSFSAILSNAVMLMAKKMLDFKK